MKAEDVCVRDGFCNWKKANITTFQQMVHGDNVLAQLTKTGELVESV